MIVPLSLHECNAHNLMLSERVPNNVLADGWFTRVQMATAHGYFHSVYLRIPLVWSHIERQFAKYHVHFVPAQHPWIITHLQRLEHQMLNAFQAQHPHVLHKERALHLSHQFQQGVLRLHAAPQILLLKIAGIWESETAYGLTFKFLPCRPPIAQPSDVNQYTSTHNQTADNNATVPNKVSHARCNGDPVTWSYNTYNTDKDANTWMLTKENV